MWSFSGFRRHKSAIGLISVGVFGVGVLTACSSGGGDSAGEALDPNRPTVKIGVLANISGPSNIAEVGGADVLQAWATDTNRNGGIAGRNIELEVIDTRADAPTLVAGTNDLIEDASVVAVVSFVNGIEGAVGAILSDSGLPVIGGLGYNPEVWSKLPGWFGLTTTTASIVDFQVQAAIEAGATRSVQASCAESSSCSASEPLYAKSAAASGLDFEGTVRVSANAPNYTAECLEFSARQADIIQLSMKPEVASRLSADCMTQGYGGYFGADAGAISPVLYNTEGIRLSGIINAFPWMLESEPVKEFRRVMEDNGVDANTYGQSTGTAAWATGELFAKVMGSTPEDGELTRASVLAGYGSIVDESLDGLLPTSLTFTAGQPAPLVECGWIYKYEDAEFTVSESATCL